VTWQYCRWLSGQIQTTFLNRWALFIPTGPGLRVARTTVIDRKGAAGRTVIGESGVNTVPCWINLEGFDFAQHS
jgi:hypothetical protein